MDLSARLTAVISVVIETFHKCSIAPMLKKYTDWPQNDTDRYTIKYIPTYVSLHG